MSARLGQPIVIENRGAAGGILGNDAVAKAHPDGHTLLLAGSGSFVISSLVHPRVPYDVGNGFAAIGLLGAAPNVIAVDPRVPVRNLPRIAGIRARPQPAAHPRHSGGRHSGGRHTGPCAGGNGGTHPRFRGGHDPLPRHRARADRCGGRARADDQQCGGTLPALSRSRQPSRHCNCGPPARLHPAGAFHLLRAGLPGDRQRHLVWAAGPRGHVPPNHCAASRRTE